MISQERAKKFTQSLAEAERNLSRVASSRPSHIRIVDIGVWSKGPYKALVVRGGLLWRSEEIGRNAIRAFTENDRATAILLTRSIIENAALHWRLAAVLTDRKQMLKEGLDEVLMKMLMGWKGDADFPAAFNVLTMIDHLDRQVEGVRAAYDQLSEVAHPNYGGVHGLFARVREEEFTTDFGADLRGQEATVAAAGALAASLGLQLVADQSFSTEIQAWIKELPSLDDEREPD